MQLSRHIQKLKPSTTLALNQKAKTLKSAGKSIVNLTTGEPDFVTPKRICKAAVNAMERGETKYTAVSGIPELKATILEKTKKEYGRIFKPSQTIVTVGAKQAIYNLCYALLDAEWEAVVISPYWTSYTDIIELTGAKPVIVEAKEENQFAPKIEDIEQAIHSKTRLLVLNSPSNPTGAVYSRTLLEQIAKLVSKWPQLIVLTDDIYECLTFGETPFVSIGMLPEMKPEQLVIVSGVSKTYAMTGWRLGYALGPEPLISAMDALQSQSTSNTSSISQWAAVEAMKGDQSDVNEMRKTFEERRDRIWEMLKKIPGLSCVKPQGAFYFFPNVKAYMGRPKSKIMTDTDLCTFLLEKEGLAVVPGSAFGAPGYIRLTYSASMAELEEGMKRLERGLAAL